MLSGVAITGQTNVVSLPTAGGLSKIRPLRREKFSLARHNTRTLKRLSLPEAGT